jgi:hypothetical protein
MWHSGRSTLPACGAPATWPPPPDLGETRTHPARSRQRRGQQCPLRVTKAVPAIMRARRFDRVEKVG